MKTKICNHKFRMNGKENPCEIPKLLKKIPIDGNGSCIFHSQDVEWKKENNFIYFLFCLFEYLNAHYYEEYTLVDCLFVGETVDFEIEKVQNIIFFTRNFIRTRLSFFDCTFQCNIEIENCILGDTISFSNCKFLGFFKLSEARLSEFTIDNCEFRQKINIHKNEISGNIQIDSCSFLKKLDIDFNKIQSLIYLEDCNFYHNDEISFYSNIINQGIQISKNRQINSIVFYENEILGESLIAFNEDTEINFSSNKFKGDLTFRGSDGKLMFTTDSTLELEEENFVDSSSRVIFDYCNIMNLNEAALKKIAVLEESDKVIVLDTNKINRLKIVHFIESRDVPHNLIQDICTLILRFFEYYYSLDLQVRFQRLILENKLKVTFSSNQITNIDDFNEKYSNTVNKMFNERSFRNSKNLNELDLSIQIESVLERANSYFKNEKFGTKDILKVLSLSNEDIFKKLNVNFIMGDKYEIAQGGAIGPNSIAKNNEFNQTIYKLPENIDYETLKAELTYLKSYLVDNAKTQKEFKSISEIAAAELAVDKKDSKKIIRHLLNSGKWVLDAAKEIGTEIIVRMIKGQINT